MAATATLQDDFQWGTLDFGKWTAASSIDQSQVTESSLYLHISHSATSGYNTLQATAVYNLTGSNYYVNVLDVGNQSITSHEVILGIYLNGSNALWFTATGGNLSAFKRLSGVNTQVGSSVTYNAATHAWWRFREAAGTIFWDTSPDDITWTNRWSLSNPFAITAIQPYMQSGCWQNESTGSYANFTNFNLQPGQLQFTWSGYNWNKRIQTGDPMYNKTYSIANITGPTAGVMTLALTNPGGNSPVAAEIFSVQRGWGYGVYTVTINTEIDNLYQSVDVGGMFTFDFTRPPDYAEIDMGEAAPLPPYTTRQILFNHTWNNNGVNTFITSNTNASSYLQRTYRCVWQPNYITFSEYAGALPEGTPINNFTHTTHLPTPGLERVHFNVWVEGIGVPGSATPVNLVMQNFSFSTSVPEPVSVYTGLGGDYANPGILTIADASANILIDASGNFITDSGVSFVADPLTEWLTDSSS